MVNHIKNEATMQDKQVRMSVVIDSRTHKILKHKSVDQNKSLMAIVREAIEAYLGKPHSNKEKEK